MKFASIRAVWKYWVAGIVLAATGVVMTRLIAPHFEPPNGPVVKSVGQLLAIAGLFIISLGVSRRVSSASDNENS